MISANPRVMMLAVRAAFCALKAQKNRPLQRHRKRDAIGVRTSVRTVPPERFTHLLKLCRRKMRSVWAVSQGHKGPFSQQPTALCTFCFGGTCSTRIILAQKNLNVNDFKNIFLSSHIFTTDLPILCAYFIASYAPPACSA